MIRHASKFDETDRVILIRQEQLSGWDSSEVARFYWCHPSDGSPHGSTDSEYVRFNTLEEAIESATAHGFTVVKD